MPSLRALARCFEVSKTSERSIRLVRAIARPRDPAAIPILAEYLDESGPVAEAVVDALVSFGGRATVVLRRCMHWSLEEQKRKNAALILARLGDARAARILVTEFLDCTSGRLGTARYLVEECGELGVRAILEHAPYEGECSPPTEAAIAALAGRGEAIEELLIRAIPPDRPETVPYALHALALMPSAAARPLFVSIFANGDADDHARSLALLGLTRLDAPGMLPELSRLLVDRKEDVVVRVRAADLLGEVGDWTVLPLLRGVANHRNWMIASAAGGAADRIDTAATRTLSPAGRISVIARVGDPVHPGGGAVTSNQ